MKTVRERKLFSREVLFSFIHTFGSFLECLHDGSGLSVGERAEMVLGVSVDFRRPIEYSRAGTVGQFLCGFNQGGYELFARLGIAGIDTVSTIMISDPYFSFRWRILAMESTSVIISLGSLPASIAQKG